MNGLRDSGVEFTESTHTYRLGEKQLSGITGMIERQLFAGKYRNVPEFIAEDAKAIGRFIHEQIGKAGYDLQLLYREAVAAQGLEHVASEYIVTDGTRFASPIDKVFRTPSGNYLLADIKTGGYIDMDYARWQLSVYRTLFLMQNPTAKVERTTVIKILKYDQVILEDIDPVPEDCVLGLMRAEAEGRKFNCPPAQRPVRRLVPTKYREMETFYLATLHRYETAKERFEQVLECVERDMEEEGTDIITTQRMVFRRDPCTRKVTMAEFPK